MPDLLELGVQRLAQRLQRRLPLVPDDIDLGVVSDGLERDVGYAFIDEALADIPIHGLRTRRGVCDLSFLELAFAGIGQQVERVTRSHNAGTGQYQRHTRGINSNPATTPLLGDVCGGARATGRIEDEVARVGGHEDAALDNVRASLNYVDLRIRSTRNSARNI